MNKTNLEENAQEYITLLDNQKQRLEQQLSEANARIAMKDEALKEAAARMRYFDFNLVPESIRIVDEAILASTESVAAWEAEKLLPLQRQVAMLYFTCNKAALHVRPTCDELYEELSDALSNTQATAEAYDKQHAAKVRKEFIDELSKLTTTQRETFFHSVSCKVEKLRAANKKGGE